MDWKAEALARVRKARHNATQLSLMIDYAGDSLSNLQGYDAEQWSMADATKAINCIVKDLFELEGKLSRPA